MAALEDKAFKANEIEKSKVGINDTPGVDKDIEQFDASIKQISKDGEELVEKEKEKH